MVNNKKIVKTIENNIILLSNMEVIRWCYEPIAEFSLLNSNDKKKLEDANKIERNLARSLIGGVGNQWTTKLCQDLVKEALIKLGRKNVSSTTSKKSSIRNKKYNPDLECDNYVYEVKGRSWSTQGTAGEKMLGVPLKYGELPRLYHKPLKIILVGYQEYEARNGFGFGDLLNKNVQTSELQDSLKYFKEHNIEYIGFTDILKNIGYPYGCWNNIEKTNSVIKSPYQHEMVNVPLFESVGCGELMVADPNIQEMIPVRKDYMSGGSKYFVLRTRGDSMNKADINDGDLVLCRKDYHPEIGNKVVALIGDDATIKELHRENGYVILKPCSTNPEHKPLKFTSNEEIKVQGVVVRVLEKEI